METLETIDAQFVTHQSAGNAIEFEKTTHKPITMDEDFEKNGNSFRANERVAHFSRSVSMNTNTTHKNTVLTRSSCNASKDDGRAGSLEILDSRTGRKYVIPISSDGTINASAFKDIKGPMKENTSYESNKGLVVYDPGYTNTSPCVSRISYIDGEKGILRYRGYPIETLAEKSSYLECAFCVIYGNLPTANQLADWREAISRHSALPIPVINTIEALPHDAHPMGVILAGLNALSVFHPEQNPALAGNGIYQNKDVQDKQIVRILGKMTTLAAHAYHRNTGRKPAPPNARLS